MGNISKNFKIQEFVPPAIYAQYGDRSQWFIDQKLVDIAEFIRTEFDLPVTINNWHIDEYINKINDNFLLIHFLST